ncbi:MAG: hypothetical protein OJF59_001913 [Cytophagales bacterium]|nr:MAG: hypothetical protein OJF59_001913 [Cytophagales bacterium]
MYIWLVAVTKQSPSLKQLENRTKIIIGKIYLIACKYNVSPLLHSFFVPLRP